jgi:hypothetical protein
MAKLIEILKKESKRKQGHRIAIDMLQGNRFVEKTYEEISAFFDALFKGMTDEKSRSNAPPRLKPLQSDPHPPKSQNGRIFRKKSEFFPCFFKMYHVVI